MSGTPVRFVEVFAERPFEGATVAVVRCERDPGPDARRIAAGLGASETVLVLPPRRDDCKVRVRTLTPRRELPLSVKAALATAQALDASESLTLEQGVTRTVVKRDGARAWAMPLARPVLNTLAVEDRALAAGALGLDVGDLASSLPVLGASCGLLTVLFPIATREAALRATLQPAVWQRLIEKARAWAAVVVVPSEEGGVTLRCLVPGAGDHAGAGTACASAAAYLVRHGVRPARAQQTLTFEQPAEGERVARIVVRVDGAGDRDDAIQVGGACALSGDGTLALRAAAG